MNNKQIHIYGKNPVHAAVALHPSSVERLFIRTGIQKHLIQELLNQCEEHGINVQYVPEEHLEQMADTSHTQGFVAILSSFPYQTLEMVLPTLNLEENPCVVILDEVQDPHNVGAVIRSAAAFGASAVIIPKHKQAAVTGGVFKASAGAVLQVPVVQVVNIGTTIEQLKAQKFWVAGLAADGDKTLWEEKVETPLAYVLGGEGRGLRPRTRSLCDFILSIPMQRDVESLNVSVTAGVALYEWSRQKET